MIQTTGVQGALSKRLTWIERNGVSILREDFSHLDEASALDLMGQLKGVILTAPSSDILELIILDGLRISTKMLNFATKLSEEVDHKVHRTAVVGLTGIKLLIMKGYNRFARSPMVPFEDEAAAIAWLLS